MLVGLALIGVAVYALVYGGSVRQRAVVVDSTPTVYGSQRSNSQIGHRAKQLGGGSVPHNVGTKTEPPHAQHAVEQPISEDDIRPAKELVTEGTEHSPLYDTPEEAVNCALNLSDKCAHGASF